MILSSVLTANAGAAILPAATVTFQDSQIDGSDGDIYNFTVDIGAADPRRYIVATPGFLEPVNQRTIQSIRVTSGGVQVFLTNLTNAVPTAIVGSDIFGGFVPLGSGNATIRMDVGATVRTGSIGVWNLKNIRLGNTALGADLEDGDNTVSANIDIMATGVAIAFVIDTEDSLTYTWTNVTERFDKNDPSDGGITGGDTTSVAGVSGLAVSCDPSGAAGLGAFRRLRIGAFR